MLSDYIWQFIVVGIIGYFIGNINFAVILSNSVKHQDIRAHGSKNPGTTNMMRVFGLKMGVITLLCDMLKGVVPVFIVFFVFKAIGATAEVYRFAMYLTAFCTTVGHVYPVFMKFKGGKGFATSIGVMLVIQPIPTLIILAVGCVILLLCDRMSVFALFYITAELIFHILAYFGVFTEVLKITHSVTLPMLIIVALFWCLVFYAHRSNIVRIIKGVENPSGLRKALFKNKNKNTQQSINDSEKTIAATELENDKKK